MTISYDLHTHSYCSDGKLSPEQLVGLAHDKGVEVLALTDHDTVSGVEAAQAEASRINQSIDTNLSTINKAIQIVSGIELSAQWKGRNIHVLGLALDISSKALLSAIGEQQQARVVRAKEIAQRLHKAGITGAWEGASHYAQNGNIGRPHFAQYMIDAGYVTSFAQAFQKYLGSGKVGDVKQHWPSVAEATDWIAQAGGIAIIAHPDKYGLTRTKLYELLREFTEAGGIGLEVVSGKQDKNITEKLVRAANDFSLLASCGSDFHTPDQSWSMVGSMSPLPSSIPVVWDSPLFTYPS